MCLIANDANGDCKYAICEDCHREKGTKYRCTVTPLCERRLACHHELHDLNQIFDVWWCTEKEIKRETEWSKRAQGCVCCEGMFIKED